MTYLLETIQEHIGNPVLNTMFLKKMFLRGKAKQTKANDYRPHYSCF